MLAFARYFVEQAKANNMGTFYWMGLSDGEHRSVPEFNQADLKDAIIKGYYGEGGYSGISPTESNELQPVITGCYDLTGRSVTTATRRGVNIVLLGNGTARKTIAP
ncbi:MAG: hypothetical protein IJT98_06305 [Prevotella sp.]|nr:hypothetical protein [Prevotella sp.]